ncbi:MAG TPA: fluoride efflux transporter CrcB [Phycisphaerales bacterium]|jgi:CrcB protein|nr:fluoride efflux transporter CrcB [Phycisphaerales bacterium]
MLKMLLIFLGSGAGGLLRYLVGGLVQNWYGPSFPLDTLLINVTGCLVMGFLAAAWAGGEGPVMVSPETRAAVLIGVLGGYTTFSSFGRETLALLNDGQYFRAGLYVVLSVAVGLLAVWVGAMIAHKVYR